MSDGAPEEIPFYLQGNFGPVDAEVTAFDLPVEGAIPPQLRGLYLRNGPNPSRGDPGHWFSGDGMLHGVRLEEGRAAWYRNRWVRTRALEEEGASIVQEDGTVDHSVAKANTNVVGHAGRIFALVESSFPTEVGPELETLGTCDFDGKLTTSFTAHPKLCPTTGDMHFFGYRFFPPFLTYHRLDAGGELVQSEEIGVTGPTMIHDFAITEGHVLFMDLPIIFDLERVLQGKGFPYRWSDDYPARLGVLRKGDPGERTRWMDIDPCYVFHPMNAFEEGGRIVLDVARYPDLWRGGPDSFTTATLHRFTLDLAGDKVTEDALDDRPIEFPRVDPRREGLANRYGYAVANASTVGEQATTLLKYDHRTGNRVERGFGPGRIPGEGVFVPASADAAEDEGYVMLYVYDSERNASDLVILDATNFAGPSVAEVKLPQRVPFGFHGNWIPEPDAGFSAARR